MPPNQILPSKKHCMRAQVASLRLGVLRPQVAPWLLGGPHNPWGPCTKTLVTRDHLGLNTMPSLIKKCSLTPLSKIALLGHLLKVFSLHSTYHELKLSCWCWRICVLRVFPPENRGRGSPCVPLNAQGLAQYLHRADAPVRFC